MSWRRITEEEFYKKKEEGKRFAVKSSVDYEKKERTVKYVSESGKFTLKAIIDAESTITYYIYDADL